MPHCHRLGHCCHTAIDGGKKPCPNLRGPQGKTWCVVYRTRIGRVIGHFPDGKPILCVMREEVKLNFPGCDYNKEGQQMIDVPSLKLMPRDKR